MCPFDQTTQFDAQEKDDARESHGGQQTAPGRGTTEVELASRSIQLVDEATAVARSGDCSEAGRTTGPSRTRRATNEARPGADPEVGGEWAKQ